MAAPHDCCQPPELLSEPPRGAVTRTDGSGLLPGHRLDVRRSVNVTQFIDVTDGQGYLLFRSCCIFMIAVTPVHRSVSEWWAFKVTSHTCITT